MARLRVAARENRPFWDDDPGGNVARKGELVTELNELLDKSIWWGLGGQAGRSGGRMRARRSKFDCPGKSDEWSMVEGALCVPISVLLCESGETAGLLRCVDFRCASCRRGLVGRARRPIRLRTQP